MSKNNVMNKKSRSFFTIFCVSLSLMAFNANSLEKYVSEELPIYLKRGPGNEYAIIGTINSGDKVTVLATSDNGKFTQIRTEAGKVAWANTNELTSTPSLKEQVAKLTSDLTDAQEKLASLEQQKQALLTDYTSQLNAAKQKISSLEQNNSQLKTQSNEQQQQIDALSQTVDKSRQELMLTWFTRGGLVAGIGLILGLVLPLILPRRRKKDRWMS